MPKISAAAAAQRRNQILEAARRCFAEHGIHVSVDEICARAGVSKGAFYLYFDSKDAAIEALAKSHAGVVSGLGELETIDRLIEKLAQLRESGTAYCRLELETWSYALSAPALRAALHDNSNGLRQALTRSISRICGKSPQGERLSPSAIAEILTIFSMGLLAACALGTDESASAGEAALRQLVTTLVTGKPGRGRKRIARNRA